MPQQKIGVLISGGGTNLQAIIDNIKAGNINGKIEMVISNKKDAYGLVRATNNDIEAMYINPKDYKNSDDYNKEIINQFTSKNIDLIVLAGYLKILSSEFIETYRNRIINIHPSLMPSFCGKGMYGIKVHEAVLKYGSKITGATVHFVDEGVDTGAIIFQDAVKVEAKDTPETLQKRVLAVEHKLLPLAVKLFCENKLTIVDRKVILV